MATWAQDHAEYLRTVRQLSQDLRRPIVVGEFGLASGGDAGPASVRAKFESLLSDLEQAPVDLAAFWVFDLDSQNPDWNVTFENSRAFMLKMTADANRRWNAAALRGLR